MSGRNRAMLLGAALTARRGSLYPDEGAAEVATASLDEEAGLGGGGGGGTTAVGAPSTASHDVSIMPTVVENRQGVVAPAAEPPALEASETKMDEATLPIDATAAPEVISSMRQRGAAALGQGGDEPQLSSPSSGGAGSGGSSRVAKLMGSTRGSPFADSSGHGAGSSILAMFRKASHTFTHHNALAHGNGVGEHPENSTRGHGRHRHGPVIPARGKLTEEDEAMLSDSEADYDAFDDNSERAHKKLLSPNFRFFRWYTTYMLLVLLAFVFYMPIRIAFFPREGGAWSAVDLLWNVLFAIDIVIRLNTGFVDCNHGTVVYDRAAIFWRYAKGWLIVDFLAAFPFTFIPGLGPEDAGGNHEAAYLLSLPKMFRVYSLMAMVQENHRLHEGCFMAVRTLLSVIVTAQLFGCGWYILATLLYTECEGLYFDGLPEGELIFANGLAYTREEYIDSECPWIYRNDYAPLSVGRRYLGSVYWALTTLTTVGYGDLSARTTAEQIYSMAVQIVGVSWYGYIVGTWASVLNSFDREDKEQRSKMREVVAFSKAAGLPPDIAKKVRQHFRFALYRQDNWITFNEQELVSDMPSGLRADVITHVHMSTISQIPWLEGKEKAFVADVAILLKPRLFMSGDLLYRRASQPDEMFFIASGLVMLKYKQHRVGFLRQGQMAGLIGLVSFEKHRITAVAQRDAHCYGLSRAHFMELMESYPKEMQELVDAAKSLAKSIALSSSEAKRDLMSNDILSALISKPQVLAGVGAIGGDRWTELQNDSMGRGSESSSRGSLPVAFSQAPQHASQQQQQQSSFGNSLPRTSGSETDALSSSEASRFTSNPNPNSNSSAAMPTSLSMGSMPRSAGGSGEVGAGAGGAAATAAAVEEAVGREVSRRLSAVEGRLGAVMERLEGFLDAADPASEK